MLTFRIYCAIVAIGIVFAGIPYDEIDIRLFDNRLETFESKICDALTTTENIFNNKDVKNSVNGAVVVVSFVPYVGQVAQILPVMQDFLASESDWKESLTLAIADETQRAITENNIRSMESILQTIKNRIPLLNRNDVPSADKRANAYIIHNEFDKMINEFDHVDAIFKEYPLLGSPPLITLALLVATFTPIANGFEPPLVENSRITCKVYNSLLEYRSLATYDRLKQLNFVKNSPYYNGYQVNLVDVMYRPYSEYGYNKTSTGLSCRKCDNVYRTSSFYDREKACFKDALGTDEYNSYGDGSTAWFDENCAIGYLELLRNRIEKVFPIALMSSLCPEKKQQVQ